MVIAHITALDTPIMWGLVLVGFFAGFTAATVVHRLARRHAREDATIG